MPSPASRAEDHARGFRFFFLVRYPLLLAIVLPLIGVVGPGSSLLGSAFEIGAFDLALVTFIGFGGCYGLVMNLHVFVQWAPDRFGVRIDGFPGWLIRIFTFIARYRWWLAPLLTVPVLVAAILESDLGLVEVSLAILGGGVAAVLALWILSGCAKSPHKQFGFFPETWLVELIHRRLLPLKQRIFVGCTVPGWPARVLGPGYVDQDGRFSSGHLFLMVFFGLAMTGYLLLGYVSRPTGPAPELAPTLAYILVLWSLLVWALSGLSFLCDGRRIPPLLAVLVFSFALYALSSADHYYEAWQSDTETAAARTDRLPGGAEALFAQLSPRAARSGFLERRQASSNVEILVATSGGGITASSWTAHVLTELEQRHGAAFTRPLSLISAVSGGSVGTLFYLDGFRREGRDATSLGTIRCRASASSLRQVSWGIVYPDAARLLFAPIGWFFPLHDRGWALEVALQRSMGRELEAGSDPIACRFTDASGEVDRGAAPSFADWRRAIGEGELPAAIFNATVSDTGEMFLLSPVDLESDAEAGAFSDALTFRGLYPNADIAVTTAARLSANFPWIGPIARPSLMRCESDIEPDEGSGCVPYADYHVADGGYYDNFGVASLAAWIRASESRDETEARSILVIEVRAFESLPARPPRVEGAAELVETERPVASRARPRPFRRRAALESSGWSWAFLGPLKTMLSVRNRSQLARNDAHLELLEDYIEQGPSCIQRVSFELARDLPLSWKLRPQDIEAVRHELVENEASFREVADFLADGGCGARGAAADGS